MDCPEPCRAVLGGEPRGTWNNGEQIVAGQLAWIVYISFCFKCAVQRHREQNCPEYLVYMQARYSNGVQVQGAGAHRVAAPGGGL